MYDNKLKEELKNVFDDFETLPVMFIGAGMSFRYINMPKWEDLLRSIAAELSDGKSRPYELAEDKAKRELDTGIERYNGNSIYPLLATNLSREYNLRFNGDIDFQPTLQVQFDHYLAKQGSLSPFKLSVADKCSGPYEYTETFESEKDSLIKIDNKISHFITTNYDTFIEDTFSANHVIIGQENILSKRQSMIGDIYKIHGCISQPETIVIDDSDYKTFEERQKYLSSKLLTLFLEHPVFFIGYNLDDSNIKSILNDIKICINPKQYDSFRDRWFFIDYLSEESTEKQGISTSVIEGLTITRIALKNYNILYDAIATIKTKFTIAQLRGIEDIIVDLIQTSDDQKEGIHTKGLNDSNLQPSDLAVVLASKESIFKLGFTGLRLIDLCKDVLFNTYYYDSKDIVEETILNQKPYFSSSKIPMHGYIKRLPKGYKLNNFFDNKIIQDEMEIYNKSELGRICSKQFETDLSKLITNDMLLTIQNIYYNLPGLILDEVTSFMKANWKDISTLKKKTNVTKIVCYIDYLRER